MKYKILTAYNQSDLQDYVNDEIIKGWQPLGGLAAVVTNGSDYEGQTYNLFMQAMIKQEMIT